MSAGIRSHALAVILVSFSGSIAFGQTHSLALSSGVVSPGGTLPLNLSLSSAGGSPPAGIQWTLAYSPSDIVSITASAGVAATAAGKSISCAGSSGSYTCFLSGINTNTIQNGVAAVITLTTSATTTGTSIGVTNALGASLAGSAIPIAATGGSIMIPSATLGVTVLACNPTTVISGAPSTCTVTLNQAAPAGGSTVTLASNNAALTTPASVTVAAGATTATFTATAGAITTSQNATITAALNSSSPSVTLSLVAPMLVTALACNPTTVNSGASSTCTVTLNQAAPAGGSTITLASNNTILTTPASVTVAAGATTATFTAIAGAITTSQNATITASLNSSSPRFTLSLVAPTLVTALACNPTTVNSGASSTCTVTLNQAAPAGGSTVTLASNNTLLTTPASVTVAAGATTGTFTATAGAITTTQNATITASFNSSSPSVTLSLLAPMLITELACSPTELNAGAGSICTVTLSAAAPAGGVTASVSVGSPALLAPASVNVPASSSTATFSVTAASVTPQAEESVVLTAALNGTSQSATFTVICPCSIWPSTAQPLNPASASKQAIEVGMKFTSAVPGYVTGVRFFKGSTNTGTHIGNLWSAAGSLLASVTFSNETASGWQLAYLPSPVPIAANTTYVVSYHAPRGHNAADNGYFTNAVENAPLQALADSQNGPNGVYVNGPNSAFPSTEASATNYWVDVVFNISPTIGVAAPVSLWTPSTVPGTPAAPGSTAAEVGTEFTSTVAGYITSARFYKSVTNTGTHMANLWTSTGTLLGSVTFTNESAQGWQQANFASPLPVAANSTYVISYWCANGSYSDDANYFATSGVTSQMLYAPVNGQNGPNGVFSSRQKFPAGAPQSDNYWVDIVFTAAIQ